MPRPYYKIENKNARLICTGDACVALCLYYRSSTTNEKTATTTPTNIGTA